MEEKYLKLIEAEHLKKDVPKFNIGDTVDVELKIVEEGKSRLQTFEGILIARRGSGIRESITVRKISYGEGVEMVLLLHSPSIAKISVKRSGNVRRAKLYYLKKKIGKATKVEEKITHAQEGVPPPLREEAK